MHRNTRMWILIIHWLTYCFNNALRRYSGKEIGWQSFLVNIQIPWFAASFLLDLHRRRKWLRKWKLPPALAVAILHGRQLKKWLNSFLAYYTKRHLAASRQREHPRPRMGNKWTIGVSSRLLRQGWTPLTSAAHGSRKTTFTGIFESIITSNYLWSIYDVWNYG